MQPPFVMDKWIVGLQENQRVDYTVNYEVSCFGSCGRHPHKIMQINTENESKNPVQQV